MNDTCNIQEVKAKVLISLVLILAILIAYLQVGRLDFVDFDPFYITDNPRVRSGLSLNGIIWSFTSGTFVSNYWHPLTWLSHMLDCQLYGLNPAGHHWTSLQLHMANTLLLFFVLQQMTGALGRSAVVAALFALHPLHVESVAWIAERKDVLSTFFWLLTMLVYACYSKKPGLKRYLLVLMFFSMGLMSKPMVVTLPFVLLLMDFWPLGRLQLGKAINAAASSIQKSTFFYLVAEKIPFFILTAAASVAAFIYQQKGGALPPMDLAVFKIQIANALVSYVSYIGKMIWPSRLAFYYPHPGMPPLWQAAGAGLLLLGLTVVLLGLWRRWPYLAMGWLWYLGTLVPVIGLVKVGHFAMADRYTYVPLIGLFIAVVWGMAELGGQWRYGRILRSVSAGAVLSALMVCTWFQVGIWQDSRTLFSHALTVTNNNWKAHYGLGRVCDRQGKLDNALRHYAKALQLNPTDANTHNNLGTILARQGNVKKAVCHYNEALKLNPNHSKAHNNLGVALAGRLDVRAATYHFNAALEINPENVDALVNFANLLAAHDESDQAVRHLRQALRIDPSKANAHYLLGKLLIQQGQEQEAMFHFTESIAVEPDDAAGYNAIGVILVRQGKCKAAGAFFQKAVQLAPGDANFRKNLELLKQAATSASAAGPLTME